MATLASDTPPTSPPFHRRRKSWGRRIEHCCCTTFSYFPLTFVYGLSSWAVWVEVSVSFISDTNWLSYTKASLGVLLWGLANGSYTIAVFTTPGSTLDPRQDWSESGGRGGGKGKGGRGEYEGLPTYEDEVDANGEMEMPSGMTTVTAKSTGKPRYCQKCQSVKPDRTHHCSTCKRCVLKMDHHCPWLATCVGLHNYKPFLLFLIYTSLFCWLCFGVSASWVWAAITDDAHMRESFRVVNTILLAVLGGIIGLVLSGFTGWHLYLVVTGQTTIESLEKTRYLNPLRKSMERQLQQQPNRNYLGDEETGEGGNQEQSLLDHLKETHANALPGVLRPEEGEDPSRSHSTTPIPRTSSLQNQTRSPAKASLQRSYASLEEQRERERYDAYLDEVDSEKLPNAFDLGWKRNLQHVFGHKPFFAVLPVCNTSGDGWMWEVSPQWMEARAEAQKQREARARQWEQRPPMGFEPPPPSREYRWAPGQGFVNPTAPSGTGMPPRGSGSHVQMQPLDRRKGSSPSKHALPEDDVDDYDTSSDDEDVQQHQHQRRNSRGGSGGNIGTPVANWNDIPEDFLTPAGGGGNRGSRSRSRGRTKGD